MRSAYQAFIKAVETFSAILMAVLCGVVVVEVFFRYGLNNSLAWYNEFAGFILVWLTMYGSVLGLVREKHIGFDTLVEMFPAGLQRFIKIFSTLLILAFSLILVFSGLTLIKALGGQTAVSEPIVKMSWIYSVMPITGSLMAFVCLVKLAVLLTPNGTPSPAAKGMEEGQ